MNTRHQKFCEPTAPKILSNHVACFANASGGEALRPPPQPPPARFRLSA